MKVVRRLAERLNVWRAKSANYQEELDTLKVYTLFAGNQWLREGKDPAEFVPPTAGYRTQRELIDKRIYQEMIRLFTYVQSIGGADPYPAPIIPKAPNEEQLSYEEIAERRLDVLTESEARKEEAAILDKKIYHPDGYSLQIKYSSIDHPEAGFGLYVVDGLVYPGSIVAIYPGVVYRKHDLHQLNINSEYIISGYDGVVIDANGWAEEAIQRRRTLRQLDSITGQKHSIQQDSSLQKYRNPFAIGSYINHPPPSKSPNVMSYSYLFDEKEFPEDLQPYIPYRDNSPMKWYHPYSAGHRGTLLVATEYIETGQEIFLNYRYNPRFAYPCWYTQPDIEEATRRWGPTRLFS